MSSPSNAQSSLPVPDSQATLADWLAYLEQLHAREIDLGLTRVAAVYQRLQAAMQWRNSKPARFVITVAGTNGKGSTVCYLAEILQQAGYQVGIYSSPHLVDYRERVLINGQMLPAKAHTDAFATIERVREQTSLTYFEFGTLAALQLMQQQSLDIAILEVGLGGRLDAVNVVDADVAVVTSIGVDHVQFLGDNREQIGAEKVAIARPEKPLICGDLQAPKSIRAYAEKIAAKLYQSGRQFSYSSTNSHWHYHGINATLMQLPQPQLPLVNAATSLAALECLPLAVSADAIKAGLVKASLPGRLQQTQYQSCDVLLDVGHNPHAAAYLASVIRTRFKHRPIVAVVGMLADKDHEGVFAALADVVDRWYLGSLTEPRGNSSAELAQAVSLQGNAIAGKFDSVEAAFRQAINDGQVEKPLVFVFGSFYTVGRINQLIRS